MESRDDSVVIARRELVLVVTLLVAMCRAAAHPEAFIVAGLLPVVTFLAAASLLRAGTGSRPPYGALVIPSILAGGAGSAIGLVPAGLGLVPALGAFALLLDGSLALELRLAGVPTTPSEGDRSRIVLAAVGAAFAAFTGVAAIVPGGWADPGAAIASGTQPAITEAWLLVLAIDDALIAFILGYRVAALRYGKRSDALRSGVTYAIVIAVVAGTLGALELPALVGPAVLALVFYLWDAIHAAAPARRQEPRFLWETALLAALAIFVVAWNLRIHV